MKKHQQFSHYKTQKPKGKYVILSIIVAILITYVCVIHQDQTVLTSTATTLLTPRQTQIQTKDVQPVAILPESYNEQFLSIINDARKNRIKDYPYPPVDLSESLSEYAGEGNQIVHEYLKGSPRGRLFAYGELYLGSIFVIDGTSTITNQIAKKWCGNPREIHKLSYPFISRVGLSIKAYKDCVICLFIFPREDTNPTDRRYLRLLPIYYENSDSIYGGNTPIGK